MFDGATGLLPRVLNSLAHLWLIYLWAAGCAAAWTLVRCLCCSRATTSSRGLLESAAQLPFAAGGLGGALESAGAPLSQADHLPPRAPPGHPTPARDAPTFLGSGLLHEYNFSIHNARAYEPGHALAFFAFMWALGVAEQAMVQRSGELGRRLAQRLPSPLIALGVQLAVLPAFEWLFVRSWLGAGMPDALAELVPCVA